MPSNKQTLEQRLATRLWVAPQQKLLGRLVEMNTAELEQEVRRVTDENPALEEADTRPAENEHLDRDQDGEIITETADQMYKADYRDEDDIPFYRTHANNRSADDETYEPTAIAENSIIDHLTQQIGERDLTPLQQLIAQYIIGNIDDTGYLRRDAEAMAYDLMDHTGYDITEEDVQTVLDEVRELDPPGIAATDLRDCLLLQLQRKTATETAQLAYTVVDKHFDLLSKKHYDRLASAIGVSREKLKAVTAEISRLNPKPGSAITGITSDAHSQQITPDFIVETEAGEMTLTLVNTIPDLQISQSYSLSVEKYEAKKPASQHERDIARDIKEKYSRAKTFIEVLKQRQATLYRTMEAIMLRQRAFFLTGDPADLRPMVLKEIAADVGYDVSVISRATRNKYVSTQWGTFPLKYFFSEGLQHSSGQEVSSREILAAIESIIDGEDKSHPLSDDSLCQILNERGYEIARRTIAKYRERLAIPVARLRKEI